jgi:hypothetical protein
MKRNKMGISPHCQILCAGVTNDFGGGCDRREFFVYRDLFRPEFRIVEIKVSLEKKV